ncbi:hypothetical protein GCM10010247_44150 [Streptomyces calvus]|nr:hypothetical protein GCM10010247_44150 [Streptomyces calvus]
MSHSTVSHGSGLRMFVRERLSGRSSAEGAAVRRALLLRQGAQSAERAVLRHSDGAG